MTAVKRKTVILVCVVCAVAALAIAIGLMIAFAPQATDEFLPKPDKITCYYGDMHMELTAEQRDAVYFQFSEMVQSGLSSYRQQKDEGIRDESISWNQFCKNNIKNKKELWISVEFSYSDVYRYTGSLGEGDSALRFSDVFDGMLLVVSDDDINMIPKRSDSYQYLNGGIADISFQKGHSEFYKMLNTLFVEHLWQAERPAVSGEIVESEQFLPPPDDVVLMVSGRAIPLTEAEKQELYRCLIDQMDDLRIVDAYKMRYDSERLLQYMTRDVSIEFRYGTPHAFNGSIAGTDAGKSPIPDIIPDEEWGIDFLPHFTYDAVLFVSEYENGFIVLGHKDGVYYGLGNTYEILWFTEDTNLMKIKADELAAGR